MKLTHIDRVLLDFVVGWYLDVHQAAKLGNDAPPMPLSDKSTEELKEFYQRLWIDPLESQEEIP